VTTGFEFTCVVQTNAVPSCWGSNDTGQLGLGAASIQAMPLAVAGLGTDVTQMAAGNGSFCVDKSDGSAWCWGANLAGQPDDGPSAYRPSPVEVTAFGHSVVQVANGSGDATCMLTRDLGVWCWGSISNDGGNFDARPTPFLVDGLPTNVGQVAIGWAHACARTNDGMLWCWGRNDSGQLGEGTNAFFESTPIQVAALGNKVDNVVAGGTHSCARTTDGILWCWGSNDSGQLGDGTTQDSATPLPVKSLGANVQQASPGPIGHTCACLTDGTAWCWGRNESGQLGDGSTLQRPNPVQVTGLASVVEISTGASHTCARTRDGSLWCWGGNGAGQLGNGKSGQLAMESTPVRVAALGTNVVEVRTSLVATCARGSDGSIWCWGAREYGMMGDGDLGLRSSPALLAGCN
jgi:alpha-tubulin suppressor-like RCC1 family protein